MSAAPAPVALDLPGPTRRITVEPLRLPDPARGPEPLPAFPDEPFAPVEPERERDPLDEPAPA